MNIEKYCRILGVKPGDSAEVVKSAFREKIKEFHPDRGGDNEKTKLILEAYNVLKHGVPKTQTNEKESPSFDKEVFREFLNRIFASDPHILRIINEVLNYYGLEEVVLPIKTKRYYKQNDSIYEHEAWNEFESLEKTFHAAMERFNSQKSRPIRYRALELIKNLSQLQILYRSFMVKYPSFTLKCKQRLQQIEELMAHAKMAL